MSTFPEPNIRTYDSEPLVRILRLRKSPFREGVPPQATLGSETGASIRSQGSLSGVCVYFLVFS